MTKYFLYFLIVLLACGSTKQTETIYNLQMSNDCIFWLEIISQKHTIRGGISGPCKHLNLDKYALALDSVLSVNKISSNTHPDIEFLYLNIYDTNDSMKADLITRLNYSHAWESNVTSDFDKAFQFFNEETGYIIQIENVVRKYFGDKYTLAFEGINCIPRDKLQNEMYVNDLNLNKTWYALTFGLAVFNFD